MDVEQKSKYIVDCVMRWIFLGILIVAVPPVGSCMYKIIVGFKINYIEYAPDALLVVVSVCCNLLNMIIDREKKINYIIRWAAGSILGIIGFLSLGLFWVIRTPKEILLSKETCKYIYWFSLVILVLCFWVGIIIESYTGRIELKEYRKKCSDEVK